MESRQVPLIDAELVGQLYECLIEGDRTSRLLACLTRAFSSTYSALLTKNRITGAISILGSDVLTARQRRAYESYYSRLQPVSFFGRSDFGEGQVFSDESYLDYDGYLKSEIYNDFFRPLEADHLLFLGLRRDRIEDKSLVLRRSRKAGFYDREAKRRLAGLGGHLRNAEQIASSIEAERKRASTIAAVFDRLDCAAFVTDRAAAIHYMTPPAERLLRRADTLTAVGGRLVARQAEFDRRLQAAIRDCATSIANFDTPSWRMLRAPLPRESSSSRLFVRAMTWRETAGAAQPASLVIVAERRKGELSERLRRQFNLTPAESRVAGALCEGRSVSSFAARSGHSVQTVRTLLKYAMAKTETHSQAELVSLLLESGIILGL